MNDLNNLKRQYEILPTRFMIRYAEDRLKWLTTHGRISEAAAGFLCS